jgi:3-methyladenine DNA glycosylase Tag
MPARCEWAPLGDPDYLAYHDEEWEYSLMQAVGMVNDHVVSCFRHGEVG